MRLYRDPRFDLLRQSFRKMRPRRPLIGRIVVLPPLVSADNCESGARATRALRSLGLDTHQPLRPVSEFPDRLRTTPIIARTVTTLPRGGDLTSSPDTPPTPIRTTSEWILLEITPAATVMRRIPEVSSPVVAPRLSSGIRKPTPKLDGGTIK